MSLPERNALGTVDKNIVKAAWIAFLDAVYLALNRMPTSLSSSAGRAVVVSAAGDGMIPADADNGARFGGGAVSDYIRPTVSLTGATETVDAARAASGAHLALDRATAQTVTLASDLPLGWEVSWAQIGAGQATFAAGSGVTIRSRPSHSKSAGQYAAGGLRVVRKSPTIEILLTGDTAA